MPRPSPTWPRTRRPGLRDRGRKDLRDLTCQVLCGIADCRRARAEKPEEFERVLEAWSASMPAAAALHVDTAIQAQAEDRADVAEAHRQLALELVDLMETELAAPSGGPPIARPRIAEGPVFSGPTQTGPDPQIARRAQASQLVTLLSIWLLQLRGDLPQIQAPLARAQQRFPQDPLVALALGSLHEAHAAPQRAGRSERRAGRATSRSGGRRSGPTGWSRRSPRTGRPSPSIPRSPKRICVSATCCCSPARPRRPTQRSHGRRRKPADRRWRYLAEMLRADAADAAAIVSWGDSVTRPRLRPGPTRSRPFWR